MGCRWQTQRPPELTCSRPESRPPPCPNAALGGAAEGPPGLRCFLLGGVPGQGAHSFWEEICVAGQGPAPSFLQAALDWHLPGGLSLGLACCTFSPRGIPQLVLMESDCCQECGVPKLKLCSWVNLGCFHGPFDCWGDCCSAGLWGVCPGRAWP